MIFSLKNEQGFIYAYIGWETVDKEGKNKNDSEYLYINDLWIHPQYRKGKIINLFIRLLEKDHRTKNVKYIYLSREKYDGRLSKLLTRNRAVKKGVDYAYAII